MAQFDFAVRLLVEEGVHARPFDTHNPRPESDRGLKLANGWHLWVRHMAACEWGDWLSETHGFTDLVGVDPVRSWIGDAGIRPWIRSSWVENQKEHDAHIVPSWIEANAKQELHRAWMASSTRSAGYSETITLYWATYIEPVVMPICPGAALVGAPPGFAVSTGDLLGRMVDAVTQPDRLATAGSTI